MERPNILLVLSDDHSVPWMGSYGAPVKTPNLDAFAGEGLLFERAFTSSPQCVPSRVALLTGRSPIAARVGRFGSPLPPEVPTVAELLREQAGYYTGTCRRDHHLDGWTDRGNTLTRSIWEEHDMLHIHDRFDFVNRSGSSETVSVMNAFLDKVPEDAPFFLWLNFNDPHHPWISEPVHDPEALPMPGDWPDLPELRQDLARYCDEIARMDGEFKQVLDVLAGRGLADDTIVIFMGDNGAPLPFGKGSLHERGLHVPLAIRWPGVTGKGNRTRALVSGEDLAPTLMEAAGLKPDQRMSGISFIDVLQGKGDGRREFVFGSRIPHGAAVFNELSMSSQYDLGRSVRDDRYKLIINYTPWMPYAPTDSAKDPGWLAVLKAHEEGRLNPVHEKAFFTSPRPILEFYDLDEDPYELNNLAEDPACVAHLRRLQIALQEKMITDYDFLPLPLRE